MPKTKAKAVKAKAPKKPPAAKTTPDEVERQLTRIRAVLAADDAADPTKKMSANVYSKLSTELRGWVKLRHEIEKSQVVTEDRLVSHPKFIELRDAIVQALVQYPDAARAVATALGQP